MRNKHLRMLVGIITYPFKTRRSYEVLQFNAASRAEKKRDERVKYFKHFCNK